MIVFLSYQQGSLWVRQLPLRQEELLVALPGPATLRQIRTLGPERIAQQSTLFPSHKSVREYPGLGRLVPAKRVETWIFSLQTEEYPITWTAQIGLVDPKSPKLKLARVRVGADVIRTLKIQAGEHEVHLTIPPECTLASFQPTEVGLEPDLFDKVFGEELSLTNFVLG
jgi:hypothetical protein